MRRLLRAQTAERLMRWAALPIADRRWAAPLSAVALGFGLFVGVVVGPGTAGTFAGGAEVIEIPGGGNEGGETGGPVAGRGSELATSGGKGGALLAEEPAFAEPQPTLTPPEGGESRMREAESPQEGAEPAAPKEEKDEAESEAPQLVGVVVHVNEAAGSYTVAEEGGVMSAVHAAKRPALGSEVEVPVRSLANGTLAEAGRRKATGHVEATTLAGIVSFVSADPAAPAYAVSNRGTSLLVRVHPDPSGVPAQLPALGAYATVTAQIEKPQAGVSAGGLWQSALSSGGAPFTHVDLEGIVAAVYPETAQLAISADDLRAAGQDLLLAVPPSIDVSKLLAGESVLAGADIGAGGALALTGLAGDGHLEGADDKSLTQGDLVPTESEGGASR